MRKVLRLSSILCLAVVLGSAALIGWEATARVRHVEYVTALGQTTARPDAGANDLIVPEHDYDSYQWILQTQQMFARHEWRVRHVDYENAPTGHFVTAPSPYRWWLGLVAWIDHLASGRTLDQAVEHAALFADPLLQVLAVLTVAGFVAWRFGWLPAMLAAGGLAAMFPFNAGFLAGAPNGQGLVRIAVLWSVLLLVAGVRPPVQPLAPSAAAGANRRRRRWFVAAGFAAGCALWLSPAVGVPLVVGCAIGALVAAWAGRPAQPAGAGEIPGPSDWRVWAVAGAAATVLGFLAEYFPGHLATWEMRAVHPLYAVAWLGLGELLAFLVGRVGDGRQPFGAAGAMRLVVALVAVAAVPVALWKTGSRGFLTAEMSSFRLTILADDRAAQNLWTWLVQNDVPLRLWATLLPVLIAIPAGWVLASRRFPAASRAAVAVAFGPLVVALGFAGKQLGWWGVVDAILVVLLIATAAACRSLGARQQVAVWAAAVIPFAIAGLSQVAPSAAGPDANALANTEIYGLIERDLASWLRNRVGSGAAVALASHNEATTLYFYGRIGGLATLSWENKDGLFAAVRITSASTIEEAQELMSRRGVTHIVIPSWDGNLDEYARTGMGKFENTFMERLHFWKLPPWLRPVPYQMPAIPGFENQWVTVFEIVEDQEESVIASRTAEYYLEMGQLPRADAARQALRRFPADIGALTARANIEVALGDQAAFGRTIELLVRRIKAGADRSLLWDRRVSLAVVLMRGKHADLAKEQVQRCLADLTEARLRFLTTESLYRLLVLAKAFDLPIQDARLHQIALTLLPPDMQQKVAP